MNRGTLRALAAGMVLLAADCWLPDGYKGEIDVKSDSTFQANFTGKLTAVEVAAALAQHKFTQGDAGYTKAMNDEVGKARQDPGTKSIDPIGAGMVQATYATDGKLASGKRLMIVMEKPTA